MEWFLKSLGVSDEVTQHLDKAELAFQRPAVLWCGLLLLVPIGYFIYRRQKENLSTVPKNIRIALTVTRVLILLVLIGTLAGPYLKIDQRLIRKPIVAVLFDTSQSMQLPAGPFESEEQLLKLAEVAGYKFDENQIDPETVRALNEISRTQLAQQVVRNSGKTFLEPLQDDYDLQFYSFGGQASPVTFDFSETQSHLDSSENVSSSHIGEAVFRVLDDAAGQQVAGVLLLSDGQNTGGRSPSQAARAASENQTPLFVIPVGSSQPVKDVSIVDVYTSGLVAVGDMVRVHITIESQGFDGQPVRIELKDGDELLDEQERMLQGSEQQQVELTFEAKQPGPRYLTINIPHLPEETGQLRSNNSDTAFVRISEEKLRVLFIDGMPRWDFRFLKNAIRRDHGLAGRTAETPDIVLETEWRRLPDKQKTTALPRTLEEIAKYHTIIVGDVSPELLDADFRELLSEAVREQGIGLIVAAGTQAMPFRFDEAFQSLLPVKLKDNTSGTEAPAYKPFRIELSPNGLVHETMRLYDDPGRNRSVWDQMPPYYWCANVERPSAAATVLAWNPGVEGRYGKMPLIAYHYAGDGKVLFLGTDSTWLWRQNVGDRFFYKFWGQSIRFVARRDESAGKKSWIEVQPVRAQPGEEAQIALMAFRADGSPENSPKQSLIVLGPDSRETIELLADPAKEGRYIGKFIPQEPGVHRLTYEPTAGSPSVEAVMRVLISPEEFRHPNLNRPALELLASATGGATVELPDLASISEMLKGEAEFRELHREATIWDNWLTLLIVMMTYSVDVGIRRLMGLS